MKTKYALLLLMLSIILSCSKNVKTNSKQIEGVYALGGTTLIINDDNTCYFLAVNACVKGVVEIRDSIVEIKTYIPEVPFVLYGRKNHNYYEAREDEISNENKIMYQNFENANALVNHDTKNNSLQSMTPLLNKNASCVDFQIEEGIKKRSEKFYFAINGQKDVYEFENNDGYTDFIVQYIAPEIKKSTLILQLNKKNNTLTINGKILKKGKNLIPEKEVENLIAMYNRAYPETEYYYCNSSYNFFEEKGVDVKSGQYKKVENDGEYFYIDKYNKPPIQHDDMNDTIDYRDIDKEAEYKSNYQILEYKKIEPTILKNKTYKTNSNYIFGFSCDKEVF